MKKDGKTRFPCHIYGMADAGEAHRAFRGELVREYGDNVALEDGTVLHWNYEWDDGSRDLVRCGECGGLLIRQSSEYHSFSDDPDGYYRDWIPAASVEEADLMNLLLGALEMEQVPCRHLRSNDFSWFWTQDPEPEANAPDELRRKIREQYAGLSPAQRKMLEKLIRQAGKQDG